MKIIFVELHLNEILFVGSETIDFSAITPHFHALWERLQKIFPNCESLQQHYQFWKKVGRRISDEDYVTSRQQVKKINPQEVQMQKLFLLECLFALVFRCQTAKTKNKIDFREFSSLQKMNSIFETLKHSQCTFLFENDVFQIWNNPEIRIYNSEFDATISNFIPQLLLQLETIIPERIFPILQQELLAKQERKWMGEFYTPHDLAKIMRIKSEKILSHPHYILDLSCGSGVLLTEWMQVAKNENLPLPICIGIDINPLAVLITQCVLTMKQNFPQSIEEPLIFCADPISSFALQKKEESDSQINHNKNSRHISIDFLGIKYDITIEQQNTLSIYEYRNWIRKEIQKNQRNEKSSITMPKELTKQRYFALWQDYGEKLLIDQICVAEICTRSFDLIVGNPPYLRVQSIQPHWKRDQLTQNYQAAIGHYDLYYLFIELGIQLLAPNGILVYITSNKFMSTGSGKGIRNQILERTVIREILDFHDSHVFNALVLPVIFILQRKSDQDSTKFRYTYIQNAINVEGEIHSQRDLMEIIATDSLLEEQIWSLSPNRTIKFGKRMVDSPFTNMKKWSFLSDEFQQILEIIRTNCSTTLEHEAQKIIVGIKTTADYAFIDDFSTQFLNTKEMIHERKEIMRKYGIELYPSLIHGKQIRNFQILPLKPNSRDDAHIFFPYFQNQHGKLQVIPEIDLPFILNYMKNRGYFDSLRKREYLIDANKQWYEIWNTKNPKDMAQPLKIVVPDISPKNNFAIDYKQRYLDGNAYYIILKDSSVENYRFILGILNSYICEFFHKLTSGNQLYAGRFRYWSTNIKQFPIISYSESNPMIRKQIIDLVAQLETQYSIELDKKLNQHIFALFQIEPSIKEAITRWVEINREKA